MKQVKTMETAVGLSVATSMLGIAAIAKSYEDPVDFPSLQKIDPEVDYVRVVPVERLEFMEWMRGRKFGSYSLAHWENGKIVDFTKLTRIQLMRQIRWFSKYTKLCVTVEHDNDILAVSQWNKDHDYKVRIGKC